MIVTPIRPDVSPKSDGTRELIDFAIQNIEGFAELDEPVSVALVVIGRKRAGAVSWSLEPKAVGEVCGYAAALLMNRAAQTD